jgi:hypothetical protein
MDWLLILFSADQVGARATAALVAMWLGPGFAVWWWTLQIQHLLYPRYYRQEARRVVQACGVATAARRR